MLYFVHNVNLTYQEAKLPNPNELNKYSSEIRFHTRKYCKHKFGRHMFIPIDTVEKLLSNCYPIIQC